MRKGMLRFMLFLGIVLLVLSCAPKPIPSTTSPEAPAATKPVPSLPVEKAKTWQEEWEKGLEAAKKEGTLVVYGSLGTGPRSALTEAFKNKYGIRAEMLMGRGSDITPKLLAERRAGLRIPDLYVGGSTPYVTDLKPAGALDSLEPLLLLPEVLDPKLWWGDNLPWIDQAHSIFGFGAFPIHPLVINTQMVKEGEIRSYKDLLNPKWKGKIVMDDPTVAGAASKWFAFQLGVLGIDFFRELARQEPIILRDRRLEVEWVARGKYPMLMCPKPEEVVEFVAAGAPMKMVIPAEGTPLTTGSSNVALLNGAPHPNAAKLFVNWLLTKEGQTVSTRSTGNQSARLDVPTDLLPPEMVRQPGVKYLWAEGEDFLIKTPELRKVIAEIFAASLK